MAWSVPTGEYELAEETVPPIESAEIERWSARRQSRTLGLDRNELGALLV